MKTSRLLLGLGALSAASIALADVSVTGVIRIGEPPPPPVVVLEPAVPGPPPWAPAHGRRAKYAYYYYPGCDVYYRPGDRMWIYLEGGRWSVGAGLPTSIRIDLSRSVSLEMDSDRPYLYHEKIRAFYPANVKVKADRGREASEPKPKAASDVKPKRDDVKPKRDDEGKGHGKKEKGGKGHP